MKRKTIDNHASNYESGLSQKYEEMDLFHILRSMHLNHEI